MLIKSAFLGPIAASLGVSVAGIPQFPSYPIPWVAPYYAPASARLALVAVFERVCIDGTRNVEQAVKLLRTMGYTERQSTSVNRVFVKDRSSPEVQLERKGFMCMVIGDWNAGNSDQLQAMIKRRLPQARTMPAQTFGAGAELAWATGSANGVIVLKRVEVQGGAARHLVMRIAG